MVQACATLPPAASPAWEASASRLGTSWRAPVQPCWRCSARPPRRRRQRAQLARAALLDPPPFDPAKLSVEYLPGGREAALAAGRRYTLTHNDVTGSLQLSIGREYNRRQLDGWYTRMLRDEILAEWQDTPAPASLNSSASSSCDGASGSGASSGAAPQPSLHVYCHVSGEELWPAPPQLRSFIFQREMALVLDTIRHAEAALLAGAPALLAAPVYVHLRSDIPALDRVVAWGVLGDRATWRTAQSSVMRSLLSSVLGTIDEADATDGSNGSWSRASFAAGASWDGGAGGAGADSCAAGPASWGGGSWDAADPQQQQQQQLEQQAASPGPCSSGEEQQGAAAISESAAAGTSSGGGGLGPTNSAVSLAAQQVGAESSAWLGATAALADSPLGVRRRAPVGDVVPAAVSRHR